MNSQTVIMKESWEFLKIRVEPQRNHEIIKQGRKETLFITETIISYAYKAGKSINQPFIVRKIFKIMNIFLFLFSHYKKLHLFSGG